MFTERFKNALAFANQIKDQANCIIVSPQDRHWEIFTRLCNEANTKGNLIPDAFLAALAIETGSEWITTDRDFCPFPRLKWSSPE